MWQKEKSTISSNVITWDCSSNPHSIIILDNSSIHHVDGIADMIQEVGALVMYLPPYSPCYNPIEELFSKYQVPRKATIKWDQVRQ